MRKFNYKKSVQLLNFFACKSGKEINRMKALKLIWLSDRLHLRVYGRPILNDTYYAMKLGPVASKTSDLAENKDSLTEKEQTYRAKFITTKDDYHYISVQGVDFDVFSQTDIKVAEDIYEEFGNMNEFKLSDESHKYPEWKCFKMDLEKGLSRRFRMKYEDFFLNAEGLDNPIFRKDIDGLSLTKELYQENANVMNLL